MNINALRPSSLVRGVENIVIGASRAAGHVSVLAAGGVVVGAQHAADKARDFGHAVGIEYRARLMAANIRAIQRQQQRVQSLDIVGRHELMVQQFEIAQRCGELLAKR
jgi:hypothetical protein